ncbi:MAG: glutamate 5-kinase [Clostridia bacterium]|nr:glutamate 5-kinase [Clostridia bacterium]
MRLNGINTGRVVVKVGTSTLTHQSGFINLQKIDRLVTCLADLHNSGKEIILVSSGAVSCGLARIGFDRVSLTPEQKQAAAAVGQCQLIDMYSRRFSDYGITAAQMLLTRSVVDEPELRLNAGTTLELLLKQRVVPIINENDTISTEQIRIGSNDTLAAAVAVLANADLLINMSDVDGLYDSDPRENPGAKLIEKVTSITAKILSCAGGAGSSRGTGGMIAKLESARTVFEAGIPMVIVNGADPLILYDVLGGDFRGTLFLPKKGRGGKK